MCCYIACNAATGLFRPAIIRRKGIYVTLYSRACSSLGWPGHFKRFFFSFCEEDEKKLFFVWLASLLAKMEKNKFFVWKYAIANTKEVASIDETFYL